MERGLKRGSRREIEIVCGGRKWRISASGDGRGEAGAAEAEAI